MDWIDNIQPNEIKLYSFRHRVKQFTRSLGSVTCFYTKREPVFPYNFHIISNLISIKTFKEVQLWMAILSFFFYLSSYSIRIISNNYFECFTIEIWHISDKQFFFHKINFYIEKVQIVKSRKKNRKKKLDRRSLIVQKMRWEMLHHISP